MLGCFCRATSTEIRVDKEEMADVRWFDAPAVQAALDAWPDGDIVLPPKTAIAHHLIRHWLEDIAPKDNDNSGDASAAEETPAARL